jgi:hypothetical protein|tara:strand:- start:254 stop:634 length:381 start_codon:yes stop_codon:yes gene_type:complete
MSFLTKILGLDKIKEINKAKDEEQNKLLSAKDLATKKKQPWVGVIDTHINKDNVKNGFFELDWNDLFIKRLIKEGYGVDNDKHEEIVDRWFRELCANVVVDGDFGGPLDGLQTGNIDINNVKRNND